MTEPTSNRPTWEEVQYKWVETGWFDPDRHKTFLAMQHVVELLSDQELTTLLDRVTGLFAPSPGIAGDIRPGIRTPVPMHSFDPDSFFEDHKYDTQVYLSPVLERMSQRRVDSTVAHEFAHVILGHTVQDSIPVRDRRGRQSDPAERNADKLIQKWGFDPAYAEHRVKAKRRVRSTRRRLA